MKFIDTSQIPCNIILKRTTPRLWLPTLTVAWGIVATLLGIVQNKTGFFIARFFLGVTESGLFPGKTYASWSMTTCADKNKAWCIISLCGTSDVRDNIAYHSSSALHPSPEHSVEFWHT
jgi:hypothetical protein